MDSRSASLEERLVSSWTASSSSAAASPAAAAPGRWPPPLAVALACRALAFCAKCVLRHAGGLDTRSWAGLPGAAAEAAVAAALERISASSAGTAAAADGVPPPPPLSSPVCPCCSGLLQGGGSALSYFVPASSSGGSSSVLLNTAGQGRASVAQDVVQGLAAQAQAEALAVASGRAPRADKGAAAAAGGDASSRDASASLSSLPPPAFAALLQRPLRHHAATGDWLAEAVDFVASSGYDLREGLALSIAVQPAFDEAEAAARARLCAALGVRSVPHSARSPDAKELLRAALSQALERIVYDSQLGRCFEEGELASVREPATVMSVVQAERAVARLVEVQQAPVDVVAPAPPALTHVQRLAGTLRDAMDARDLVSAVSDAVLLDARQAQAAPLALGGGGAQATVIVPVALQEASAQGLGAADQAAAAKSVAGNKRPREAAAAAGAAGRDSADADRFVDVAVRCDSAVVSMGLVDATCDFRALFDSGAAGGVYVGSLAAPGFAGSAGAGSSGSAGLGSSVSAGAGSSRSSSAGAGTGNESLRRLVVSQASSLKLSVAVDATPSGLLLAEGAGLTACSTGGGASASPIRVSLITTALQRGSFFLKGRYCKFRRGLSQTPWFVEGHRKASSAPPGDAAADADNADADADADADASAAFSAAASSDPAEASGTSVEELLGAPIAAAVARWGGQGCAVGFLRPDAPAASAASPAFVDAASLAGMVRLGPSSPASASAAAAGLRVAPRFKFHSAGREDVDVRMLGAGRPFAVELVNARACLLPLAPLLRLHAAVNAQARGLLESSALSPASRDEFARLAVGADGKRKSYTALVWSSAPHDAAQLRALLDLCVADLALQQRTPIRVLHRRSLMARRKVVHSARTDRLGPHFFLLHLVTSAGTYVKEFVHGDLGRTRPNVGELLSAAAEGAPRVSADILMLDVTGIVSGAGGSAGGAESGSEEEEDED